MWSILQKDVVQYFPYLLKKWCAEIFLFDHDLACRTHKIAVFSGGVNFYFMFIYNFFHIFSIILWWGTCQRSLNVFNPYPLKRCGEIFSLISERAIISSVFRKGAVAVEGLVESWLLVELVKVKASPWQLFNHSRDISNRWTQWYVIDLEMYDL